MILDAGTLISINQALTSTAVSTGTYDVAGLGIGQPVTNIFGIQGAGMVSFGQDLGGGGPHATAPQLGVFITKALIGGTSLQVQLQAAVDVSNTGLPVTWDSVMMTGVIPIANLIADATRPLVSFTIADRFPTQGFPRFYRLNYVIVGPFTGGAVSAGLLTGIDDVPFYGSGF